MRRASAKVLQGREVSKTQCSGSSTPSGACTSCTSTTVTPRKGSCQPPGRQGPSKSTCTLRSSTIAVRAGSPPRDRSSTVLCPSTGARASASRSLPASSAKRRSWKPRIMKSIPHC